MIGLAMGRRRAESMMKDTCRITAAGEPVWDETTMDYIAAGATVYEGPCRLLQPYRVPTSASTPGQVESIQLARLSLPVATSTAVREGHEVEYLTSASDPGLPGRKFKVAGNAHQSDATARRLPVEEHS